MRKAGLEREGEYSVENLTYKVLRRIGYLDKLRDLGIEAYDVSMSLEEEYISERKKNDFPLTTEKFFSKINWADSYRDLYPGYSSPEDINEYEEDYYFNTKKDAEDYAKNVLEYLKNFYNQNPIILYRAIYAPSKEDINIEWPGESWTPEKSSALQFGSHNDSNFLLIGQTTTDNIDWEKALELFSEFSGFLNIDAEFELPVISESDVKVVEIEKI